MKISLLPVPYDQARRADGGLCNDVGAEKNMPNDDLALHQGRAGENREIKLPLQIGKRRADEDDGLSSIVPKAVIKDCGEIKIVLVVFMAKREGPGRIANRASIKIYGPGG